MCNNMQKGNLLSIIYSTTPSITQLNKNAKRYSQSIEIAKHSQNKQHHLKNTIFIATESKFFQHLFQNMKNYIKKISFRAFLPLSSRRTLSILAKSIRKPLVTWGYRKRPVV